MFEALTITLCLINHSHAYKRKLFRFNFLANVRCVFVNWKFHWNEEKEFPRNLLRLFVIFNFTPQLENDTALLGNAWMVIDLCQKNQLYLIEMPCEIPSKKNIFIDAALLLISEFLLQHSPHS